MNWMVFIVQMTRLLAWPVAVSLILYWYRSYVSDFANFVRGRQFKISAPMFSFEAAGAVQELRNIEQQALPSPAVEAREVAEVVEARRFILRDDAGRERAEIAMSGAIPFFRLVDSGGDTKFLVAAGDKRAAMSLQAAETKMILVADEETGPRLALTYAEGRPIFEAPQG